MSIVISGQKATVKHKRNANARQPQYGTAARAAEADQATREAWRGPRLTQRTGVPSTAAMVSGRETATAPGR